MRDPVQDARAAQEILDNEVFKAAVEDVNRRIFDEWRDGPTVEDRERAHAKQAVLQDVLSGLARVVNAGLLHEHMERRQVSRCRLARTWKSG